MPGSLHPLFSVLSTPFREDTYCSLALRVEDTEAQSSLIPCLSATAFREQSQAHGTSKPPLLPSLSCLPRQQPGTLETSSSPPASNSWQTRLTSSWGGGLYAGKPRAKALNLLLWPRLLSEPSKRAGARHREYPCGVLQGGRRRMSL